MSNEDTVRMHVDVVKVVSVDTENHAVLYEKNYTFNNKTMLRQQSHFLPSDSQFPYSQLKAGNVYTLCSANVNNVWYIIQMVDEAHTSLIDIDMLEWLFDHSNLRNVPGTV